MGANILQKAFSRESKQTQAEFSQISGFGQDSQVLRSSLVSPQFVNKGYNVQKMMKSVSMRDLGIFRKN